MSGIVDDLHPTLRYVNFKPHNPRGAYLWHYRLLGDFLIVRSWNIKTKQFLAELRLLHPGVHIY
jgi:hypothetical protein